MKNIYQLNLKRALLYFTVGLFAVFQCQGLAFAGSFDSATDISSGTTKVSTALTFDVVEGVLDQIINFPTIPGKTYGDVSFVLGDAVTDQGLAVTYTAVDPTIVQITGNTATLLQAGSTSITATQAGDAVTDPAIPVTQVLTVAQKVLTVTSNSGQSKFYGTADPLLTYVASGFVYDDDESLFVGALSRGAGEGVGSYAISQGSLDAGESYTISFVSSNFQITPAPITGITFENKNFEYDGTVHSLAITGTLPTGTAVVYSNNGRMDAGSQIVTATISGSNYITLVLTATLTITRVPIPIFAFNSESFEYDGTAHSLEISGTIPVGTIVTYRNNSRTDVGNQLVIATISGENYTPLSLTASLTVTPTEITGITLENASFEYDQTIHLLAITGVLPAGTTVAYRNNGRTDVGTQEVTATITGANYNPLVLTADLTVTPATITGIVFEDNSFVYDGTAKTLSIQGTLPAGTTLDYDRNRRTNVGTQAATATIAGSNYNTLVLTADLTITPAIITGIVFDDGSFVYDGTTKSLAIEGVLPAGTTVDYSNNDRTDVGTQEVIATVTGPNYTALVLTADLTVTPAIITGITLEEGTFVYDGESKSLEITGDLPMDASLTYTNNSRTDVGTQEVTATISRANFTTLVLTAGLTITPATITGITFEGRSFVYDGSVHSLEIVGAIPAGATVAYSNNERTNVGTQEVTATISGSNYIELILIADLTITPATITGITLEDNSFVYDGTAHSLAVSGIVPIEMEVTYSNNGRTDVGAQEVIATISMANFNSLVLTAELAVTVAEITGITFEGGSFVYDGMVHSLEISGALPVGTTVAYSNNDRTDTGTQGVTATISGSNYSSLVLTADLTVTQKTLSIVPDSGQFKYQGNSDPDLTYQVTGWVEGEGVALITGKLSRATGEAVGEYQITAGSLDAGSNYLLELQPNVFTIKVNYIVSLQNPDMITTAWNTAFDQVQKPTTVLAVLVDGSSVPIGVTWTSSGYNQLEAGIYTLPGVLSLNGIENPQNFEPELLILVEDKLPPTDIKLSNATFAADINKTTAIGNFSTVDTQDNVHTYQLVNSNQNDGKYFRLEGNVLYWNSEEALLGKTSFTIKVSSTDRKGNSIEREFTLTRSSIPIDQIEVFTAFTPNGDGVNDTWGVPGLKYVQGGSIHVFDRSGRRLFSTDKPGVRWDGTFEGNEMPAGAYIWVLEFKNTGEVRRGTLSLLKQ